MQEKWLQSFSSCFLTVERIYRGIGLPCDYHSISLPACQAVLAVKINSRNFSPKIFQYLLTKTNELCYTNRSYTRLTQRMRGTYDQISIGETCRIEQVGGEGPLRCRLLDMGLIPGTAVTVTKIAPMGDPIELRLRGYTLTIRLDDARQITICEREAGDRA